MSMSYRKIIFSFLLYIISSSTHSYRINRIYYFNKLYSNNDEYGEFDPNSEDSKYSEDERLAMLYRQRQVDSLREYLQPIASGLAEEMSESDREKEFGKRLTPEVSRIRQLESLIPHDYIYPPTTELPFENEILRSRYPKIECNHKNNRVYIPTRSERFQFSHDSSDFKDRDPYRVYRSKFNMDPEMIELESRRPLDNIPDTLNEGWELLPCKTIFKHKLMYPMNDIDSTLIPNESSCVFVKFQVFDAESNRLIYSNRDFGGDLLAVELSNSDYAFRHSLLSMYAGEMAEFVMPFNEFNAKNREMNMFSGVNWVRLWIYLNDCHDGTFKWWDLGPFDQVKEEDYGGSSQQEYWERRTDQMVENIKTEMANDPSSVYWHDALDKMSDEQKKAAKDYFEGECEEFERKEHMEYSGSRGFKEAIRQTGQFNGIDVGHIVGGRSTNYCYKETEFTIYLAIPVKPGIRAQHININVERYRLEIRIGGVVVFEDNLIGPIDIDQGTNWCMSDEAMKYQPLEKLPEQVLNTTLVEDDFDSICKLPSIIIVMSKADHHQRIWGIPFEKN